MALVVRTNFRGEKYEKYECPYQRLLTADELKNILLRYLATAYLIPGLTILCVYSLHANTAQFHFVFHFKSVSQSL